MARDGILVYHELRKWLEPYGDAECGRLLKAMLDYSITGEAPELSGNERFIWPALRDRIDKDRENYESKCKQMQANASRSKQMEADASKSKQMPADASKSIPTTTTTTTATTTKSPTESIAHVRGEYGWVKLTDDQYSKLLQELGQEELDRCIRYVDESAQSTGNKNKWKDWNLTVRKCHRDGWGLTQSKPKKYVTAAEYVPPKPPPLQDVWNIVDQI